MKREHLVVLAFIALAVVVYVMTLPKEAEKEPFVVVGDVGYLTTFLDANTVVVRVVYPFTDAQGAVAAITYASAVLTAKGKRVIIQTFEGNLCYTNEGNVEGVVERNIEDCELNLPTITVREGTGMIRIEPHRVEISGTPKYLQPAVSYVLRKIYPDADIVYARVFQGISRRLS